MKCPGLYWDPVDPPETIYQRRGSIQNTLLGNLYVEPSIPIVDEVVYNEVDPEYDDLTADPGLSPAAEFDPSAYPPLSELLVENRRLREAFTGSNFQMFTVDYYC